ncbi:ShlB/FhaC/HecB family hemolysin secretion/activation protein [Thermosynechococcus sp. JY1334]|uniref:ShlB/FhaC/HecB family hemolysin secretion/activation protein n=1 Tax=unclassified Thermosynechococcus TaxID=2622553 RepID=UPI0026733996|nr:MULTISPECIES: ShlB/FhaC/HecB family hemolysin secretion/activation protein [unclassified Thermosynechococcus]MDR7898270.1 ShlB/FhaC/HecB family hemolysin secretion/activation protein [Thermosynechococcus sp. JY1332]MDR7905672.1 ShlB/FhaC/HecB family hemolysin secretion/activation protein [Thermosynechococcus sp. JY1334]WKT85399.1 ShlB/FhaC/HecB family hemolysin secretion/activation protein [Thermosynechococcus sp. JY1339]WNC54344.1 ShlB/FhaC/HecB family hemolysin secretion/activation protein
MKTNLFAPVALLSVLGSTGAVLPALAIPVITPTQQDIQPPLPEPPPLPSPSPPALEPPPSPPSPGSESENVLIPVQKIVVEGSTIFGPAEFDPIIKPLEGRQVTLAELQGAADAITKLYLEGGYLTSRAVLGEQVARDGVITIQVLEGRLEDIRIEGNKGIIQRYIRSRIALGAGVPLNSNRLEEQLRLLRTDPLFANLSASLRPGTTPQDSILVVRVVPARWFNAAFGLDNNTPPAIAPDRATAFLGYNNLSGRGDSVYGSYAIGNNLGTFDWGASNTVEFGYSLPLNAMNGTLTIRTVQADSEITRPPALAGLNIRSESSIYEASFRQPVIRNIREELAFGIGFLMQSAQTFVLGVPTPISIGSDPSGYSATRVLEVSQEYIRRDPQGAWVFRSQFNFGLPIFGATENPSPTPDGTFFSWLGQGQRLQRLWADNFLILRTDVQLSPNSLLPFHQFVIGGPLSVRGYSTNALSGDNGLRFSGEARFPVLRTANRRPIISIGPLFDLGVVWNNSRNPAGAVPNNVIAGLGMGLLVQPTPNLDIQFQYAAPLIDLPGQTRSLQSDGIYFTLTVRP